MLATACNVTSSPGGSSPDEDTGIVKHVEDGDSIDVETGTGTLEVRLIGVNAPDRGECFADESRDFLAKTLEGKTVTLDLRGEDQFGRVLAVVLLDDDDINHRLVERGMALAITPTEGEGLSGTYVTTEGDAYREGVGLWHPSACGPATQVDVEIEPSSSVPNPSGPDDDVLDAEGIALVNVGATPADISGWLLRDESSRHRHRFSSVTVLQPGGSLFVSSSDPGWSPGGSPVWNNAGDMALLLDRNGNVVARWRY